MATAAFLVGLIVFFAVLMVIARGVAREQKALRDTPYDRRAVRAKRHAQRQQHAAVVRTMLFGRWAEGHRAGPDEFEEFDED
jgi:hypothetical protein